VDTLKVLIRYDRWTKKNKNNNNIPGSLSGWSQVKPGSSPELLLGAPLKHPITRGCSLME
jgi:hypothetical protein